MILELRRLRLALKRLNDFRSLQNFESLEYDLSLIQDFRSQEDFGSRSNALQVMQETDNAIIT